MTNQAEVPIPPAELMRLSDSEYVIPFLFGYITSLPDNAFLDYVIQHRQHKIVRRVFFSEIRERAEIDTEAADAAAMTLLSDIEKKVDRTQNEALMRYLMPHLSKQMRGRVFLSILRCGTRATKAVLLRREEPHSTPGVDGRVFELALEGNEDALVGIVYRWPVELWKERATELFAAAENKPWLQRQIIFKTDEPDRFLDDALIHDPITELYVRARYHRPASDKLIDSAIQAVSGDSITNDRSDRVGLVAWCLGRYRAFEKLQDLPRSALDLLRADQAEAFDPASVARLEQAKAASQRAG